MIDTHPDGQRRNKKTPCYAPETMPLFDHGQVATATRRAAYDDARPRQPERVTRAVEILRQSGTTGCTRHELSVRMELPIQTVCGITLRILRAGLASEPGTKRQTPTGSMAAVIVHSEVA